MPLCKGSNEPHLLVHNTKISYISEKYFVVYQGLSYVFLHFESLSVEGQNWGTIENIFAHEHIQLVYTKASVVSRKNVRCFATNLLAS